MAVNLLGMPGLRHGGAAVYAGMLVGELANGSDTELRVLCADGIVHEVEKVAPTAEVVAVGELKPKRLRQALNLLRALREPGALRGSHALPTGYGLGDSELVHYPMSFMAPPHHDRATVVTAHDLQHVDRPHGFPRRERLSRRFRWHTALRAADRVIANSAFTRDSVVHHLGVDPARIDVIHMGVHATFFEPPEPPHDGPPGEFLFYPALPYPHKNHVRLLRAFKGVASRHPGLRLVLSGGPLTGWGRVEAEIAVAGLGDRVELVGHLSLRQLKAHYLAARAMVFPSLYEGFGFPLVEAMALGCPIVAAQAGSIPEVLGEGGRLFDPRSEEAIEAAIEDCLSLPEADRLKEVDAARSRARLFTIERMGTATLRAYERALGEGG